MKPVTIAILVLVLISSPLFAQDSHNFFDKTNIILWSADETLLTYDIIQTHRYLSLYGNALVAGTNTSINFHEANPLVKPFVHSTAGLVAWGVGSSTLITGAAYIAHRTRHHKIERLIFALDGAAHGGCIINNYVVTENWHLVGTTEPRLPRRPER